MFVRLDHLVIAVLDPDAAADELEQRVGVACTGSGRHPAWGTYNRLAWFGDTYVELIGVFDRALTRQGAISRLVMAALDAGNQGLVTYAIATDDVDGDRARLRAAGAELSEVEARSRTRPDGEVVRWRATFPPALGPAGPPFLVEHELVGAEWGADVRAARAVTAHPIGGPVRVTALTLPTRSVEETAAAYQRELDITFDGTPPIAAVGDQEVRLVAGRPLIDPAIVELRAGSARPVEVEALGVRWHVTG